MLQSSTAAIVRCRSGRSRRPVPRPVCWRRAEQGRGGEQPQARGGELEREGEPVELACDGGQGGGVVVGDLGGGAGGRGPVEQQGDGGRVGHRLDVVVDRRGQRAQHDLVLGAHPQRRPAGRQDDEVGAARDEVGEHRCGPGELLEVVEHEEHAQAPEVARQGVERVGVGRPRAVPRAAVIRGMTSAGWRTGARSTATAPPGNAGASRASTSSDSRVLPTPPGPVMVTSRCPSRMRARSASTSASRPMSGVAGAVKVTASGMPDAVCAPGLAAPPEPSLRRSAGVPVEPAGLVNPAASGR